MIYIGGLQMKKKLIAFILTLALILSSFAIFPVSASVVETVTVPVTVTSNYKGVNDWANATFTCTLTDGVPATYGTLSNGIYSFMYKPSTGEIKKNAQTDIGFSFVGSSVPVVVVPWKIEGFSISSTQYLNAGVPVTTTFQAKTIAISATGYIYIFNTLSTDVQEIAISEGVETLASSSFYGIPSANKTVKFILPSTLKTIGSSAFCGSGSGGAIFTEIVIPPSVTTINATAFGLTRFTDCTIPAGVTAISNNLFQNNNKLINLTIKGQVTSIGNAAFSGDSALKKLTFEGRTAPSSIGTSVFTSVTGLTVYYPGNGSGYDSTTFRNAFPAGTTFTPVTSVPIASGLSISGKPLVGETLQGSYSTYTDSSGNGESGSTATWRRADNSSFSSNVEDIKTEPISAGSISTYTLTSQDIGKYIQFSVIPRNQAAEYNVGEQVSTVLSQQIRMPVTVPIVNLLTPKDGFRTYEGRDIALTANVICDNTTITKVEYYANDIKCAESTVEPFSATWSGAQIGNYQFFAKAYNALGESAASSTINMSVLSLSEQQDAVWAKKWGYDFNQFNDSNIYTSTTPLTFPGVAPPSISISTGGTAQSAHGLFGKAADDYSLQINSINGAMSPATLSLDISQLDDPIDNVVAQMDVAFSTTNETRNIFSYRTPVYPYDTFVFASDGKIKYKNSTGLLPFKDDSGNDLTYEANKWYHVAAKYDFVNKTAMYYIDGKKLITINDDSYTKNDFISTSEIKMYGTHSSSQTGVVYVDNLFIGQEQDSYVTSVLTSPIQSFNLKGSAVNFTGYAKDANGKEISKVEIYANDNLIAEKTGSSYNFSISNLACGAYDIVAKAINTDGEVGASVPVHIIVDGIFLPRTYGDGMLLQRNKPLSIAGTGINGVTVTAILNGASANTVVAGGKWEVTLPPQAATKNTTLTVKTSEGVTTVFHNVAIGELIMCSGQSNMAYSLDKFANLVGEADKDYPDIHLFFQPDASSGTTKDDIPTGYWTPATTSAATRFSGVGFLTGKKYYLSQNGEVPVGLIYAAVGGSGITSWVTPSSYDNDPDLAALKSSMSGYYNAMVAPWTDYTIGSALWYQGEADTPLTYNYEKMLTALIKGWRTAWNDDSIHFVVVQLPIYNYMLSYKAARSAVGVREGQFNVSQTLDNVATTIAIDTGSATGIHPTDKLPVAERNALALQHFINPTDTSLVWKSPSYDHFVQQGNQMTIYFKDIAGGLKTKDGAAPRGFKIAGDNGVFVDASVTLVGNTIVVDTSSVTGTPKVRYAWEDSPTAVNDASTINLVNSANLPMAPFKTDRDRYNFKTLDTTTYTLSDPVNFTPAVLNVSASAVVNSKAVITINAKDYDDDVAKVDVYADSSLLGTATRIGTSNIFTYEWNNPQLGAYSLYAIATDTAGTTSIKRDPSLGTTTVNPQKFSVTLATAPQYTILPFEDLSGKVISSFGGENGVTAKAEILSGSATLVIATYNGNSLINIKMTNGNSISFTSNDLLSATSVKAFLLNNMGTIMPLTGYVEIKK